MSTAREWTAAHTAQGWRIQGPTSRTANLFLDRVALRGLADGSLRTYAFDMVRILRWLRRRRKRPASLCSEDLHRFVHDERDYLKAVTINRHLRLLARFRSFLNSDDTRREVCRRLRPRHARPLPFVKEPYCMKRPLTDRQVRTVFDDLRTNRDRAILTLMWALGLRIGEVLALRGEDIDWEQATLFVQGKGLRERSLPLAESVAEAIRQYITLERPRTEEKRLFLVLKGSRRGQALTYAGLRRLFRYHRTRMNLPEAHPHRFRHTFAANMIRQGMSVPTLMRMLGHTWPRTTMRYIHFNDREIRQDYGKALHKLAHSASNASRDLDPIL